MKKAMAILFLVCVPLVGFSATFKYYESGYKQKLQTFNESRHNSLNF